MRESQPNPQTDAPDLMVKPDAAFDYPYALQPEEGFVWSTTPRFDGDTIVPWLPLAVLAVGAALVNLAVAPLMDVFDTSKVGETTAYACFGIVFAQAGAVSAWLAWSRRLFWMRLVLHWCYVIANYFVFNVGLTISGDLYNPTYLNDSIQFLFLLPAFALAIQVPLWLLRQYFGWRVERQCELVQPGADFRETPFTIRDLMLGTIIVAVSMTLARVVFYFDAGEEFGTKLAIIMSILAIASALGIPPIAIFLLQRQDWPTGLALVALEAIVTSVAVAAIGFAFNGLDFDAWNHFGFTAVLIAYGAAISAVALAARLAGYRLVIGRGLSTGVSSPTL